MAWQVVSSVNCKTAELLINPGGQRLHPVFRKRPGAYFIAVEKGKCSHLHARIAGSDSVNMWVF